MNAHARQRESVAKAGTLNLFALFHLNLAFSSIEEEQRGDVIARCYWPLLRKAWPHRHRSDGIHAGGDRGARPRMDRKGAHADCAR